MVNLNLKLQFQKLGLSNLELLQNPRSVLSVLRAPSHQFWLGSGMVKTLSKEEVNISELIDRPWITIVWDDPVNLMSYVTYVLMELFSFSREKAHELMMQIHTQGKAVVSTGSREEMEHDVARLHEYGLWATLQRGDQVI